MKLYQHIRFFFYIASHWGIRLGLFSLYHELKGEKKYRINSTSYSSLSRFQIKGQQLVHATEYMPVSYFTMEQLLSHLPEEARKGGFLDIGCGKGRAMCVAAHFGFTNIQGIDFAKEMIDAAGKNLALTQSLLPALQYKLFWQDTTELEIGKDISTIFLFNPFGGVLVKSIIRKIENSLQKHPRQIYVLYASPDHENFFFNAGYDVRFRVKKYDYLEGIILSR